jgi:hypothetical protein
MYFKKEGKIFDRTVATQLYSQMDKDDNGNISEQEFIRCWMNSETAIREKIQRNNEEIRKAQMCLEDNKIKLLEYKKKEDSLKGNPYQMSTLQINVIEGQNIAFEKSNVTLTHEENNFSTNFFQGHFPNYENQQFKFIGLSPTDSINLFINDGFDESNNYTGSFKVGQFQDQKIHNLWIPMKGGNEIVNKTKLHLQVHYIYSKSEITKQAIEKWQEYITENEKKNEKLKSDLVNLYSPFDFLASLNKKPAYFEEIKPVDKLGPEEAFEPKFSNVPPKPLHPILKVALIFAIILGIVACCPLDYKHHMLIDLSIIFFIVAMYFFDFIDFSIMSIIFTLVFLVVSITVESLWYKFYISNWWNSVYIDDGSLVKFRKYQKWISIVSLCVKGILFIILFIAIFLVKRNKKNYENKYKESYTTPLK